MSQSATNKKAGIQQVVISVGSWIDNEELIGMASYPQNENIHSVDRADNLTAIKDTIRNLACNSGYYTSCSPSVLSCTEFSAVQIQIWI